MRALADARRSPAPAFDARDASDARATLADVHACYRLRGADPGRVLEVVSRTGHHQVDLWLTPGP